MIKKYFQLFADTGGTFTDCIGIDEKGNEYRQKVLSNSSLRGTITKVISNDTIEISESWNLERDILEGFLFRLLNSEYSNLKIFRVKTLKLHQTRKPLFWVQG
jgi:5-oxoprolinase (ATP-hydrolysing)